jgi:2-methylaconitate isomerase
VDEGLLRPNGDQAVVRIFNTNTRKIIRSTFPLVDGRSATDGTMAIPGVAGTGAPVRLDFLAPGGATTGKLLPTGNPVDALMVPGIGIIAASLIDAANACVFVLARDLGLTGRELPEALDQDAALLDKLQRIRRTASVAMGIARDDDEARTIASVPVIGFVAPPMDAPTLSGEQIEAGQVDLTARFLSNGQPHRALPLTATLCTGVAARIRGSLVNQVLGPDAGASVRIGMPSGILTVDAEVSQDRDGVWTAHSGAFYRTARRLFDGRVYVPVGGG